LNETDDFEVVFKLIDFKSVIGFSLSIRLFKSSSVVKVVSGLAVVPSKSEKKMLDMIDAYNIIIV
jgi:hypothetical protein